MIFTTVSASYLLFRVCQSSSRQALHSQILQQASHTHQWCSQGKKGKELGQAMRRSLWLKEQHSVQSAAGIGLNQLI
jgi:hypothetical protein